MKRAVTALGLMLVVTASAPVGLAHERYGRDEERPPASGAATGAAVTALTKRVLDTQAPRSERLAAAVARQEKLVALIESDPAEALRHSLSDAERAALPADLAPYVEADETHEGTFETYHADAASTQWTLHHLVTAGGRRLSLHFAASDPDVLTGAQVRVRGLRVRESMALGGAGMTVLAAAPLAGSVGESRTVVVLVKFQDAPSAAYPSAGQVHSIVFGSGSSVSNYYREASYQRAWLSGAVVGPFTIPMSSVGCDYSGLAERADHAAIGAGVSLGQYSRRVYAFPSNGCSWWGLGSIGGNPSRAWINGNFQASVVAHELGHNYGLFHSHSLDCGDVALGGSCTSTEYGDVADVMGASSQWTYTPIHVNAVQKERVGWLDAAGAPAVVEARSSGTYVLDPYETVGGSNPKAVKVQSPAGDWYYVEYRRPTGFDAPLSSYASTVNGLLVHYWDGSPDGVYLLDMTPQTATWYDPALAVNTTYTDAARGISITPLWADGRTTGVSITMSASEGRTFADDFDRPDASQLGNGWVVKSGAFRIAGGAARNQATRGWHVAVQPGLSGATQSAAATFTAGSGGGRVGLVVRYRNSSNYLTCYRQVGANSAVRIANVVNGVETVLKSVAVPNPTAPFSLSCKATGSTVTLALNRTPRASASGLPLASGTVGLMLGGVNPAVAPPAHKADAFTATVK